MQSTNGTYKTTIKQPTSRIWIVHTLKTLVGWSFLHGWLTSINWGSWGHNCRIFSFSTSTVPGVPGSKAWIVLHKVVPTPLDQQMLKTARLDVSKSGRWQVRMGKLPKQKPCFIINWGITIIGLYSICHTCQSLEVTKPRRTGFPKIVHPKVGPWVPSWKKTMGFWAPLLDNRFHKQKPGWFSPTARQSQNERKPKEHAVNSPTSQKSL